MKITLDHKALELLLSGMSDEAVIDMRNSVLNEFIKKRVKAIVPHDMEKFLEEIVKAEMNNHVGTVKVLGFGQKKFIPSPDIEKNLLNFINTNVKQLVDEKFKEITDDILQKTSDTIEHLLRSELDNQINSLIREIVQNKMKQISEMVMKDIEVKEA